MAYAAGPATEPEPLPGPDSSAKSPIALCQTVARIVPPFSDPDVAARQVPAQFAKFNGSESADRNDKLRLAAAGAGSRD